MALFSSILDALNKGTSNKTSTSSTKKTSTTSSGAGRYTSNNPYASQTSALVNSSNKTTTPTTTNKTSTTPTTSVPSVSATQKALQEKKYQTTDSKGNTVTINGVQHKQSQIAENAGMKQPTTYTQVPSSTPVGITPTTTSTTTTPTTNSSTKTDSTPSEVVYEETMSSPKYYTGGGGSYSNSSSTVLDTINQMYDTKKQQAIAAIQNAMDNAIAGYEASIDALPQQYDPLRSQSEYERYKSQKALEEQLANSGNTYSGMGRQDTLNLQNSYSNQLNSLNMSEQNEKEELQRLIEQTRRDGEFNKANASYDFDIAAYEAALNKQSEDREYEWKKYLQDYQEKQDALDREFNTQKYYDSLAKNYTSGYNSNASSSGTGTMTNNSYQLSGNTAQQLANYNTKSAVNEAVNNLQINGVNDSNAEYAEQVIKAYYIKNGKYPTTENVEKFVEELNELKAIGREFTQEDIANYAARMNFTPYETILAYTIFGGN